MIGVVLYHAAPPQGEDPSPRGRKILEAWKYCEGHSRSVEVLYKNLDGKEVLANVHFTYDPAVSVHLLISDLLSVLDHSVHPMIFTLCVILRMNFQRS